MENKKNVISKGFVKINKSVLSSYPVDLVKINKSILSSYPVDEILKKHIIAPKGFSVQQIKYQKPFGDVAKAKVDIILEDKDKNIYNITKEIEFALTENQRVANSVSPSTFKLKRDIREGCPPEILGPSDFIAKYNDVVITSVEYTRPNINEKTVSVILSVRTNELSSIVFVPFEITFAYSFSEHVFNTIKEKDFRVTIKLNDDKDLSIREARYIGKNNIKVEKSELIFIEERILIKIVISFAGKKGSVTFSAIPYISNDDLFIFRFLKKIIVKPRFLETYPPAKIKASFLDYSDDLNIYSIKYYPPANNKSHNGKALITLISKGEYVKHTIDLKFKYSLYEKFLEIKTMISGDNFKYVGDEALMSPPFNWKYSNWQCDIKDVIVDRIEYDNNGWQYEKELSLTIYAFFRGNLMKVKKTMIFEMSHAEHMISKNIIRKDDLSLFTVPQKIFDPLFLDKFKKNPKLANKKFLNKFFITNSSFGNITSVKVTKFNRTSNKAELLFVLKSNILGKSIVQEVAYPVHLDETYAEVLLDKLTDKDIEINEEQLTICPPSNINPSLFRCNTLFRIYGVEYFMPKSTSKEVITIVKVGTGNKFAYIEKKLVYKLSRDEYWEKLEEEENKQFILNFKPEDIYIHINILGEPVSNIFPDDISGIPKEIEVSTRYKRPANGETDATLWITLRKGQTAKTFKQIIHFEKPRTKIGNEINKSYTQLIEMPTKNIRIKNKKGSAYAK